MLASTVKVQAQVVDDADNDNEETEITVTNAHGKREVIELPEAMTRNLTA